MLMLKILICIWNTIKILHTFNEPQSASVYNLVFGWYRNEIV